MPAGSQLPSYRELQQRYRLSPATVQRLLADLTRRGLVVTRPGSGTFIAERRASPRAADVSWQTLALGSRPGLGADLERLVEPPPSGAIGLASGFIDERLQPLGLLAAAASRAGRRPQGWSRLPPQGLPELRSHFAAEAGAAERRARAHRARRPGRAVGGVPAPVRPRRPGRGRVAHLPGRAGRGQGRPGWPWCRCPATPTACCRTRWPTRWPGPAPGWSTSSRGTPTRPAPCWPRTAAARCWPRRPGPARSCSRTTGCATSTSAPPRRPR